MPTRMIALPSGITIERPRERLVQFMTEEYDYYDGIESTAPDHIEPADVLVTVAMNSFVNSAKKVRLVHRGLRDACDPILARIPEDADLRSYDLDLVAELLHDAVQCRQVLVAVATKVLHRKRRHLIPMLDSVIVGYYAVAFSRPQMRRALEDKKQASESAMDVLDVFRTDLLAVEDDIEDLRRDMGAHGWQLSAVRVLEVLLWTETEKAGVYRT